VTLAFIVPSRGRPDNIRKLLQSWSETAVLKSTAIYVVVDTDDPKRPDYFRACEESSLQVNYIEYHPEAGVAPPPFARLGAILNSTSQAVLSDPDVSALGFMGDDHRPRTYAWDRKILGHLTMAGTGIVYGNDLIQGENLPTAVAMSSNIPSALGYFVPPGLAHMFLDNFWRDLGRALNCLMYMPDVVIEHCHPLVEKGEWDDGYKAVNANMGPDADRYETFLREKMPKEVERLMRMLNR
jgi:hypothetical protein